MTLAEGGRVIRPGLNRLGCGFAGAILIAFALPFMLDRPNRIVEATPRRLWDSLPPVEAGALAVALVAVAAILCLRSAPWLRLAAALLGLIALGLAAGRAATGLMAEADRYARIAPGAGIWLLVFALSLAATDALVALRLSPPARILALAVAGMILLVFLWSGVWGDLSVMREYQSRAASFRRELGTHVLIAASSLAAALTIGVPLAVLCHRSGIVAGPVLATLNVLQTIPSMALFGLLIAPLAWVGANLPGADRLGIAGIGFAPAFVALFAYALLPIVASTLTGLRGVAAEVVEAARGMGMTSGQRLLRVEMPLALPAVLTGARLVLVQNIGLAVIAGLVGGGGLGVFVFQGLSQTATDLVLLGALPTVLMAFAAAVLLDAFADLTRAGGTPR